MQDKILDHVSGLPSWMQFVILILIVLMLLLTTILKARSDNKVNSKLIHNEQKLGTLLDLLYARFANNLSLDVAKEIIQLLYIKNRFLVRDKIIDLLKFHNYEKDGKFNKFQFKYDLIEFINNRYYEDSMFLGKLTCKSIKLNFYHTQYVKPDYIIEQITTFLEISNFKLICSNNSSSCINLDNHLNSFYQTITNKTLVQLEDLVTKINTDYGS